MISFTVDSVECIKIQHTIETFHQFSNDRLRHVKQILNLDNTLKLNVQSITSLQYIHDSIIYGEIKCSLVSVSCSTARMGSQLFVAVDVLL